MVLTIAMNAAKKTRTTPCQWSRNRIGERSRGLLVGGPLGLELRGLLEPATDDQAGEDHDGADPERDAPAPRLQGVVGEHGGEREEHRRGEDLPALRAAEREAGEEAAPVVGCVLERHRVGPRLLARGGEALHDPEHDEQDRREDPHALVGRQAADEEGRDAHQQDGPDHHLLAAHVVADVAQDEGADRARDVGDAEGGERRDGGGGVVALGEEDVGEDQGGGGAVDGEVVVLQRAPDPGRDRGLEPGCARAVGAVGAVMVRASRSSIRRTRTASGRVSE